MSKIYVYLIIAGLILGIVGAGYAYFEYSQNKISALEADTAALKVANDAKQKAIDTLAADQANIKKAQDALNTSVSDIRTTSEKMKATLDKHDLDLIGMKHPKVLEDHINDATRRALEDLEKNTNGK